MAGSPKKRARREREAAKERKPRKSRKTRVSKGGCGCQEMPKGRPSKGRVVQVFSGYKLSKSQLAKIGRLVKGRVQAHQDRSMLEKWPGCSQIGVVGPGVSTKLRFAIDAIAHPKCKKAIVLGPGPKRDRRKGTAAKPRKAGKSKARRQVTRSR